MLFFLRTIFYTFVAEIKTIKILIPNLTHMCFSASASFIGATVLAAVGVKTISATKKPNQYYLALTPLIFALQQCSEGILWLSFSNPSLVHLQSFAAYTFVMIGALVWPVWIPFAVMKLEPIEKCKSTIRITCLLGLCFSLVLSTFLFLYPVTAEIQSHHIKYHFLFPDYVEYTYLMYFVAAVLPAFISSIQHLRLVGILSVVTLVIAELVYRQFVFSVWCFFVSIISLLLYSVLQKINNTN